MRAAPIRCGMAVSLIGQTGQSEESHSPEECASVVVNRTTPSSLVDRGGLYRGNFVPTQ